LLRNRGDGGFADLSKLAGKDLLTPAAHRGCAFGDFNNDGLIDIVTTNLNARPELFINRSPNRGHWLIIKLIGGPSNRDGIGTQIKVATAKGAQYNHATTSVGYSSSSDVRVHFGLGAAETVETLEVRWPSGGKQTLSKVKADQILIIRESQTSLEKRN
jgi:hypothetical protein